MTFSEYLRGLKGKQVTVIGAGVSNMPLIGALLNAGIETKVCDKRSRAELADMIGRYEPLGAVISCGEGYLDDIDAGVIFRTPGIMPSHPAIADAVRRGATLTSEMEVFFDVCPCRIIAVTGSDGKTTTTSIISEILRKEGYTVHLGGNIGRPLLCEADGMRPGDIAVVELSSFQLMTMAKSPDIAVITNVSPNHLDIHAGMDEYVNAKRSIFINQSGSCRVVLNADNVFTRKFADEALAEVLLFSSLESVRDGCFTLGGTVFESSGGKSRQLMPASDVLLPGAHNIENYMAAFCAVRGLASRGAMLETARTFEGVEHRLEFVRELRGVRYFNDSIASSPSRTIAGLRAFDRKVILIAGGKDKGVPFESLGREIALRVKELVLTGPTAEAIRKAVLQSRESFHGGHEMQNAEGMQNEEDTQTAAGMRPVHGKSNEYRATGLPQIIIIEDFEEAVLAASNAAVEGDIVLLSPACTSFDRFRNFEERGELFRKIVKELI